MVEVRFQLAALLRARHAAQAAGREQAHGLRALRQLTKKQVEPGARQGSVLVGAELGRDVQPADSLDVGSPGSDETITRRP